MTAAGSLALEFPRWGVQAVAAWLYVHGPYSPGHPDWATASRIADQLFKCAQRRKRSAAHWGWTVTLMRSDAEWLVERLPVSATGSTLIGARTGDMFLDQAADFGEDLRWALARKRGRPLQKSRSILDRSRDDALPDRTWYRRQAQRRAIEVQARSRQRLRAFRKQVLPTLLE